MSILTIVLAFAIGRHVPETPTFAEIEKLKYEAFAHLKSFRGRYDVISLPKDGVGIKQEVSYVVGSVGRLIKVVVSGKLVVQMGYTAQQRWVVDYARKQYVVSKGSGAELPPYAILPCDPGSVNFQVSESGVRIATDPAATIELYQPVEEDGRSLLKVVAKAVNPASGGEVLATEWFDKGTWIVRKFEITSQVKGQVLMSLKGFLRDDVFTATSTDKDFDLPQAELGGYQRVDG